MTSKPIVQRDPAPILACTISRDVQRFDLLIDDMEQELGEAWGDLNFEDALVFLKQPDSTGMQFVAIAVDSEDESELSKMNDVIKAAKAKKIKVLLIANQVSPSVLYQMQKLGADDFVPYPLPEGALHDAIERLPDEQREVMDLIFYNGLTHEQAATLLGVATKTIQRRLREAKESLAEAIEQFPGPER